VAQGSRPSACSCSDRSEQRAGGQTYHGSRESGGHVREIVSRETVRHTIWSRETQAGTKRRRFDTDLLGQWAGHRGFAFQREERVDHERAMEKRTQHRCVLSWTLTAGEQIEMCERGDQQTPAAFIEIDDRAARLTTTAEETIVNPDELRPPAERVRYTAPCLRTGMINPTSGVSRRCRTGRR